MTAKMEYRADQFLLWATFDFNRYKSPIVVNTHWGDLSYLIAKGGQEGRDNYDFIQSGNPDERS